MNRAATVLLSCILVCQIVIIVLMLRERAASARIVDDLLRRREATETAVKEQYATLQAMRRPGAEQAGDIRIEVLPDGSVRVDGQWMTRDQFIAFAAKKPWSTEKVIHIFAAPSTPFQSSLEIFNTIRGQGFEKINLETK